MSDEYRYTFKYTITHHPAMYPDVMIIPDKCQKTELDDLWYAGFYADSSKKIRFAAVHDMVTEVIIVIAVIDSPRKNPALASIDALDELDNALWQACIEKGILNAKDDHFEFAYKAIPSILKTIKWKSNMSALNIDYGNDIQIRVEMKEERIDGE